MHNVLWIYFLIFPRCQSPICWSTRSNGFPRSCKLGEHDSQSLWVCSFLWKWLFHLKMFYLVKKKHVLSLFSLQMQYFYQHYFMDAFSTMGHLLQDDFSFQRKQPKVRESWCVCLLCGQNDLSLSCCFWHVF